MRFLSATRLPCLGLRGYLATALLLPAFAALASAGPAQAQVMGLKLTPVVSGLHVGRSGTGSTVQWKGPGESQSTTRRLTTGLQSGAIQTARSYTVTGLTPGTSCTVRVGRRVAGNHPVQLSSDVTATAGSLRVFLTPSRDGSSRKVLARLFRLPEATFCEVDLLAGGRSVNTSPFFSNTASSHTLINLSQGTQYTRKAIARAPNGEEISRLTGEATFRALLPALSDPVLRLNAPLGRLARPDDDGDEVLNNRIRFSPLLDETRQILVASCSDQGGPYRLTIEEGHTGMVPVTPCKVSDPLCVLRPRPEHNR